MRGARVLVAVVSACFLVHPLERWVCLLERLGLLRFLAALSVTGLIVRLWLLLQRQHNPPLRLLLSLLRRRLRPRLYRLLRLRRLIWLLRRPVRPRLLRLTAPLVAVRLRF
jgi:hypothetical protein